MTRNLVDGQGSVLELGPAGSVVTGRWDGLTLPAIAQAGAERIPGSHLHVFERSAHRPWAEEPAAYFEVVGGFLAG